MRRACAATLAALVSCLGACSTVAVLRGPPDRVVVARGLRPVAVVRARVTTAYVLFLGIPGRASLEVAAHRLLTAAARDLGADDVVDVVVDVTPDTGLSALREVLGWRSARARGIAVVVEDVEPAGPGPPGAAPAAAK